MWNNQQNPPESTPNQDEGPPSHRNTCRAKENVQPLRHHSDMSMYENSPLGRPASHCSFQRRRPLDDQDSNSQDSGYVSGCCGAKMKCVGNKLTNSSSSFMSMNSAEDEILELCDLDQFLADEANLPTDFNTLISGPFTSEFVLPSQPKSSGGLLNAAGIDDIPFRPFKRPRRVEKPNSTEAVEEAVVPATLATEESIKSALQRSFAEPNLIGDFSRPHSLPLIVGRNQDLKSLCPATLASLVKGNFDDILTYKIIDCRYPYEFEGGHVAGAINIYTKEQLVQGLLTPEATTFVNLKSQKQHILVFHCEFSSNRAPNLYRFLRNCDRNSNKHVYPALHYPEIYLLEGGYKNFFQQYAELCQPKAYVPMNHSKFHADFIYFKEKSKTWGAEHPYVGNQGSLKRLSFA